MGPRISASTSHESDTAASFLRNRSEKTGTPLSHDHASGSENPGLQGLVFSGATSKLKEEARIAGKAVLLMRGGGQTGAGPGFSSMCPSDAQTWHHVMW